MSLQKKIAVVSGGSSGIGKATAFALAKENCKVFIADIIAPETQLPDNIIYYQCNLTKQDEVNTFYSQVVQSAGAPDILISNAGQGIHEKLAEGDPEKWSRIIYLNIGGTLRLIRAFLPIMKEKGFPQSIFIEKHFTHFLF